MLGLGDSVLADASQLVAVQRRASPAADVGADRALDAGALARARIGVVAAEDLLDGATAHFGGRVGRDDDLDEGNGQSRGEWLAGHVHRSFGNRANRLIRHGTCDNRNHRGGRYRDLGRGSLDYRG